MTRFVSGVTDQYLYFVAVDSIDLKTRETGLTTFTVYRSRNGGTATIFTTPTVAELSAGNMPGVYSLLLDEDMSLTAGNDSEEMVFHITQASMAPVTRTIELYRPKITAGNTLGVASDGDISGNVDGNVVGSVASVSGAVGSVTAAIVLPTIPANWITAAGINASALDGKGNWNIGKTGYTVDTLAANVITAAAINADAITNAKIADDAFGAEHFAANWLEAAGIVASAFNGKGDWNVGKTGYALTTADWNVGKTGYSLSVADWATAANVKSEVLEVLNVDTYSELAQAAPPASPTMREMMQHLYQWYMHEFRGSATLVEYYKADGTTVNQKRTVSESGGVITEEKIVTGP